MFTSQAHRDSGVAFACMRAPVGTFTGRLCSIMSSLGGVKNVSGESLGQRNNYSDTAGRQAGGGVREFGAGTLFSVGAKHRWGLTPQERCFHERGLGLYTNDAAFSLRGSVARGRHTR